MKADPAEGLSIGELARRAGVKVETVRFYEREGLIDQPDRTRQSRRRYPENLVARIRFLRRAQQLGFSLGDAEEFLSLRSNSPGDHSDVASRAAAKAAQIEAKIQGLHSIKSALDKLIGACEGSTSEYSVVEALDPEKLTPRSTGE